MLVSEYYKRENECFRFTFDGDNKYFTLETIEGKSVKIKTLVKPGFSIKVNKTSISGDKGAQTIFNFLSNAIKNDFMTVYVNMIIDRFYFKTR